MACSNIGVDVINGAFDQFGLNTECSEEQYSSIRMAASNQWQLVEVGEWFMSCQVCAHVNHHHLKGL